MRKEDWESLQGNPGWGAMRQYLRDYRARIMEQWASGKIKTDADKAAIRCEILGDLADMDWDSIDKFYRPPQGPEE